MGVSRLGSAVLCTVKFCDLMVFVLNNMKTVDGEGRREAHFDHGEARNM